MKILIFVILALWFCIPIEGVTLRERIAVLESQVTDLKADNTELKKTTNEHEVYIGQDLKHKGGYASNDFRGNILDIIQLVAIALGGGYLTKKVKNGTS